MPENLITYGEFNYSDNNNAIAVGLNDWYSIYLDIFEDGQNENNEQLFAAHSSLEAIEMGFGGNGHPSQNIGYYFYDKDFIYSCKHNRLDVYVCGYSLLAGGMSNINSSVSYELWADSSVYLDATKTYTVSFDIMATNLHVWSGTTSFDNLTLRFQTGQWDIPTEGNGVHIQIGGPNKDVSMTSAWVSSDDLSISGSYTTFHHTFNPSVGGNCYPVFKFEIQGEDMALALSTGVGNMSRFRISIDNFQLVEVEGIPVVHDLEMGTYGGYMGLTSVDVLNSQELEQVPIPVSDEPVMEELTFTYQPGWNMFSCPLDINTLLVGHDKHSSKEEDDIAATVTVVDGEPVFSYNFAEFCKNHIYENHLDIQEKNPIWYKYNQSFNNANGDAIVQIFKHNDGNIYWPEYTFNGIGNYTQNQGYQMRTGDGYNVLFHYKGLPLVEPEITLTEGWNTIYVPILSPISADEFFAPWVDDGIIQIVKDNIGNVYWPIYTFNGIGDVKPGQGYQVRTYPF